MLLSHRVSVELSGRPIPPNALVLHKCDIPACVNPDHLFFGTNLDNARDRSKKGRNNRPSWSERIGASLNCKNGHQFTETNTYLYGNQRYCRKCNSESRKMRRNLERAGR